MASMEFSVLLSIYYKEKAEYLIAAMNSIWHSQTVRPSQIVLVKDGTLTDELDVVINEFKEELGTVLTVVPLKENVGLGNALCIGLEHCIYNLIARMDTDDVASCNRFEKQINTFQKDPSLGIVGSNVSEFDGSEDNIVAQKKVPESHSQIVAYSKTRNPFNHPTVMYKKNEVLAAGSYLDCPGMEDYYLWVRMLAKGTKSYNIQDNLVSMRAGMGMLSRRRGLSYAKQEIKFQRLLLDLDYIPKFKAFTNVMLRLPTRVIPSSMLKSIYRYLRRN